VETVLVAVVLEVAFTWRRLQYPERLYFPPLAEMAATLITEEPTVALAQAAAVAAA
jgi:hypothetical protein